MAGKADWVAMGMPTEGLLSKATIQTIVREVPVCRLEDDLTDVKSRIAGDWTFSVVVDPERIVLGLLDLVTIQHSQGTVEDLMKPAPLTLRPSVLIAEAIAYFEQSDLKFAIVTKSTGELMGAIRKSDLESVKQEQS